MYKPPIVSAAIMLLLAFTLLPAIAATSVPSMSVRGKPIRVGQTADQLFAVLSKRDMTGQDVAKNPSGGLLLTKGYKADGKKFYVKLALVNNAGPYRVIEIVSLDAVPPPMASSRVVKVPAGSGVSFPLAQFESSTYYRTLAPTKDSWKLAKGGTNYSYSLIDPEHAGEHRSITLSGAPGRIVDASLSWYGRSNNKPAQLSKVKEQEIIRFLGAVLPRVKPASVIAYVRKQQSRRFTEGAGSMPRTVIDGVPTYAGVAGSSLIVGFGR